MKMTNSEMLRFIKYCLVGVLNTIVTLGVIFITKSILGLAPMLCNALGYTAGVINSFLWNKMWVFRSKGGYRGEAARFLLGFAICYAIQFVAVWALTASDFGSVECDLGFMVISGYGIATLAGNVLYTVCNFIYNRLVTFRTAKH